MTGADTGYIAKEGTKKKERRSTDCITARVGSRSETQIPGKLSSWEQIGQTNTKKASEGYRPERLENLEQRPKTSKKYWKWQRGISLHPLSEGEIGGTSQLSVKRWELLKKTKVGVWQSKVSGTVSS